MPLLVTLILVFIIGYLTQFIGLCMVRGVHKCKAGKPEFLISILLSGVLMWAVMLFSNFSGISTNFRTHEIDIWFAIGGVIFGFGTSFNQGCGVATLSRLTRGDSKMFFTVIGWLIAWAIFLVWKPAITHNKLIISTDISLIVLGFLSAIIVAWTLLGNAQRIKLWFTMMSIGLIGGFICLFDPKWSPSGFLQKISHALASGDIDLGPSTEDYFLFLSLLIGMLAAAWYTKKFEIIKSTWQEWLLHVVSGVLMGIGASLALGGNNAQLLLALPSLSPGGALAVFCMVTGIWFGLVFKEKCLNQYLFKNTKWLE